MQIAWKATKTQSLQYIDSFPPNQIGVCNYFKKEKNGSYGL